MFESFEDNEPGGVPLDKAMEIAQKAHGRKPIYLITKDSSGTEEISNLADDLECSVIFIDAENANIQDIVTAGDKGEKTGMTPASFLPYGNSKEPMILAIQNFDRANGRTKQILIQLAFMGRIGDVYTLPENCIVIFCGDTTFDFAMQDKAIAAQA